MSTFKGTPGPWKLFFASNGLLLGVGQADGTGVTDDHGGLWGSGDEKLANARLIAAAPELLALTTRVAGLNRDAGEIGAGMLAQLVDQARAAIAKALGEDK